MGLRVASRTMTAALPSSSDVQANLRSVLERIDKAHSGANPGRRSASVPVLVAVSKTKPGALVAAAYAAGQRHFGENYPQELEEKAKELADSCPELRWHFIGTLQSNKIARLVANVPALHCVQTLGSEKAAKMLDAAAAKRDSPLQVMIQVNTSGEEGKSGLEPAEAQQLATFVRQGCSHLHLQGFMTIGALAHSQTASREGENPDFECLRRVRAEFCESAGLEESQVGLSMGMSQDFEAAVAAGATSIRVGSTIFGARQYKAPASSS